MNDVVVMELTSARRFKAGNGPDWQNYALGLKLLDRIWQDRKFRNTPFGVIGPRPSWEDTITRGRVLFDLESWSELDDDQLSLIAPSHFFADGDALLGSVGRRSPDVCSFLLEPERAKDRDNVLAILKHAKTLPARSIPVIGGDILAQLCDVRGMGRSFATRLLTLARPDGFVVLNNKSREWLCRATGFTLAGKSRTYRILLEWLNDQDWFRSSEPTDPVEQRLWHIRAALLDAFAYEPWADEEGSIPSAPRKKIAVAVQAVAVQNVAPGDQQFYVFENWTIDRGSIHRAECRMCNHGRGIHKEASGRNSRWHGPFGDRDMAVQHANNLHRADMRTCKICSP